jgi:hypothetical protein
VECIHQGFIFEKRMNDRFVATEARREYGAKRKEGFYAGERKFLDRGKPRVLKTWLGL